MLQFWYSYEELGYDEYMYIACGNADVCPVCKALDGETFKLKDMEPGTNAPPMHPNCHCSTAPHEDDDEYEAWLSYLENGGTTEDWDAFVKDEWEANVKSGGTMPEFNADIHMDTEVPWHNELMRESEFTGAQRKKAQEVTEQCREARSLVEKHTGIKSLWSGIVRFIKPSSTRLAAKLPSCNIAVDLNTTMHRLIHENLHACSLSRFKKEPGLYEKYKPMEELAVEFMARRICDKEGYPVDHSGKYEQSMAAIDKLVKNANISPMEFARDWLKVELPKREEWMRRRLKEELKDFIGSKDIDESIEWLMTWPRNED